MTWERRQQLIEERRSISQAVKQEKLEALAKAIAENHGLELDGPAPAFDATLLPYVRRPLWPDWSKDYPRSLRQARSGDRHQYMYGSVEFIEASTNPNDQKIRAPYGSLAYAGDTGSSWFKIDGEPGWSRIQSTFDLAGRTVEQLWICADRQPVDVLMFAFADGATEAWRLLYGTMMLFTDQFKGEIDHDIIPGVAYIKGRAVGDCASLRVAIRPVHASMSFYRIPVDTVKAWAPVEDPGVTTYL